MGRGPSSHPGCAAAEQFNRVNTTQLIQQGTEMGKGCQAHVYKVQWEGQTAAVKRYREDTDGKAFRDELKTLEALNAAPHNNIVALKAIHQEDEPQAILMEYCNLDVESALKNSSFSYYEYLNFSLGVAGGMAHLHSRSITHGDLKLSNILLSKTFDESGEVWTAKISDYGLSKRQGSSSEIADISETYLRAPEFSLPDFKPGGARVQSVVNKFDARKGQDIFQAGWMYLEMLAGKMTAWRKKPLHELQKHLQNLKNSAAAGDRELLREVEARSLKAAGLIQNCWRADSGQKLCGRTEFLTQKETLTKILEATCSHDSSGLDEFRRARQTTKVYRVLDDLDISNLCEGKGIVARAAHNRVQGLAEDRLRAGDLYDHIAHGQRGADKSRFISTSLEKDWIMWYVHKKHHLKASGKLKRSKEYNYYPFIEIDLALIPNIKIIDCSNQDVTEELFGQSRKANMVRNFSHDAKEVILQPQDEIPLQAIVRWYEVDPAGAYGGSLAEVHPSKVSAATKKKIEKEVRDNGFLDGHEYCATYRREDLFESFRVWREAVRIAPNMGNQDAVGKLFEECEEYARKLRVLWSVQRLDVRRRKLKI